MWRAVVMLCLVVGAARAQGFTGGGVTGAYFANPTLSGTPAFTRRDVRVRFAWNGAAPGGSTSPGFSTVPASGFSARWTGTLIAPANGSFTFSITTSGPGRLWVTQSGNTTPAPVIDYEGTTLSTSTGTLTLTQGARYALTFEFQDTAQPAVSILNWSGPSVSFGAIGPAVMLGVNTTSNADWDGSRMFADAIKQCRGWANYNNFSQPIAADAQGWPTQDFLVIPVAGPPQLNGTYRLRFKGLAQVVLNFGYGRFAVGGKDYGAVLPSGVGYNKAANETSATMRLTPKTGINVFMQFGNTQRNPAAATNTGLTDIELLRPTAPGSATPTAPGTLFNAALEADFAPFTTVRYMTYLNANGNTIQNWSDRVLPGNPIQAQPNGGALEYMVMLANETGKDLWINVPVSATADYITKLAQLLRYGSDGVNPYTTAQAHPRYPPAQPNLNIYIEYSNEVWNFEFSQAGTNYNLAVAEVNAGGSPLNYDGSTNTYYWGWRRVAEQAVAISNIFRGVWGDAAMGTQIRPVLMWQGDDGQATAQQQLDFLADYYGNADGIAHVATPHPPGYFLSAGGGAWYHSVNNPAATSISALYASGLALPTGVPVDAEFSHSFGLTEAGYEGGFEIGDDGPTQMQLAANVNARAQAFEADGLNYYFAKGGGLGMIFLVAGAYSYGLAYPTVYNAATPKNAAVNALMAGPPPAVTLGHVVAGTTSLSTRLSDVASGLYYSKPGDVIYVSPRSWANWTVNVTTPGEYTVTTNLGAVPGETISVDGVVVGNSGAVVTLGAGLHGIHVRNLASSGSLELKRLILTLK